MYYHYFHLLIENGVPAVIFIKNIKKEIELAHVQLMEQPKMKQ